MNHPILSIEEYILQRNQLMYTVNAHYENHKDLYSDIDKNDIITVLQNLYFHKIREIRITQIINTLNEHKESISCIPDTTLVLIQSQVQVAYSNK
jgi:hypothetical protein